GPARSSRTGRRPTVTSSRMSRGSSSAGSAASVRSIASSTWTAPERAVSRPEALAESPAACAALVRILQRSPSRYRPPNAYADRTSRATLRDGPTDPLRRDRARRLHPDRGARPPWARGHPFRRRRFPDRGATGAAGQGGALAPRPAPAGFRPILG